MNETDKEKIENLRNICHSLEVDIQETNSEIFELEISRDTLIEKLKEARRELYKEFERIQKI